MVRVASYQESFIFQEHLVSPAVRVLFIKHGLQICLALLACLSRNAYTIHVDQLYERIKVYHHIAPKGSNRPDWKNRHLSVSWLYGLPSQSRYLFTKATSLQDLTPA